MFDLPPEIWIAFECSFLLNFPRLGEQKAVKASNFSDAQTVFILKQGADGIPVVDICQKAGISPATYFDWKKKYDGLLPTEMRQLKLLDNENAKLRKLVADLSLDREMLQDVTRRKLYGWTMAVNSFPQSGSVGSCPQRHLGLFKARQAHGQCVYRRGQWAFQGGVPEHTLVPDACRRTGKAGGLAQILQRGATPWVDWQ